MVRVFQKSMLFPTIIAECLEETFGRWQVVRIIASGGFFVSLLLPHTKR